ncbi:amino acid permease family protein [Apiospora hydei]|uniref:Amino acid permease family protein n=1 Tax=Apiospora hydei TaxID=1337664 RepID=A0ABR1UX05_9PEZI
MYVSIGYFWPWRSRKLLRPSSASQKEEEELIMPTSPAPGDLPTEILLQVAGIVHHDHPPSLAAFAQVNKVCNAAAMAWRLRSIRFEVTKRQDLRHDVERFLQVVKPTRGERHVRWLEVRGSLEPTIEGDSRVPSRPREPVLRDHIYHGTTRDVFNEPVYAAFDSDGPIAILPEEDQAWEPVVDLLKALPHLEDFVFTSEENQFPPVCSKLSTSTIRHADSIFPTFASAAYGRTRQIRTNWPSLGVRWMKYDAKRNIDFNLQAAMCLIADGMASNLKRVKLTHCSPVSYPRRPWVIRHNPPWNGLGSGPQCQSAASTAKRTCLESLILFDYNPIEASVLATWQRHTAFEKLTDLSFITGVSDEALKWAARNASFPNLTRLNIKFVLDERDQIAPDYCDSPLSMFLASLPPLESLRVTGHIDSGTIDTILWLHAPDLRSLTLRPYAAVDNVYGRHHPSTYGRDHILYLGFACSRLEKLSLPIRRQKGAPAEVDIYRALDTIPTLTDLTLHLHCPSRYALEPDDGWHREPFRDFFKDLRFNKRDVFVRGHHLRNGDVWEGLLNRAVDEALARAIWDVVAAGRPWQSPLRSLRLRPRGGPDFGPAGERCGLEYTIEHLQRSYLVERSVRDDDAAPRVVELGRKEREARDESRTESDRDYRRRWAESHPDESSPPEATYLEEVLRRMWPAKGDSLDWRDNWESLPLELGKI